MNGNNIIIGMMNGSIFTAIAAVRSHEIQTQCDSIEKASSSQQTWKEYISGRKEWNITVNYLVLNDSTSNIEDVLRAGTIVTIKIKGRSGGYDLTGNAIVVTCKQTFQKGNLSQGTFQFRGTGQLS